jgi:hypothetical protein
MRRESHFRESHGAFVENFRVMRGTAGVFLGEK